MGILDFFKKKKQKIENVSTDKTQVQEELPTPITEENKINEILSEEIKKFFPNTGRWLSNCFKQDREISYINLPCHLRENEWMSKLLYQKLIKNKLEISQTVIKSFLDNSEEFTQLRHNYELEIVRWQIDYMRKGGEGWVVPNGYDDSDILFSSDVDKMFRDGIVATLRAIGMYRDVIEEGIEKNANMWRERYMRNSFSNAFEPYVLYKGCPKPVDEKHKSNWLKMREYEYYCEHKHSVDKYGIATPNMKLQKDELIQLEQELAEQNRKRLEYIESWMNTPKEVKSKDDSELTM